jgi:hypothetical protein
MKISITIYNLSENRFNFSWKRINELVYEEYGITVEPTDLIELNAHDFTGSDVKDLADVIGSALVAASTVAIKRARDKRRDELKSKNQS